MTCFISRSRTANVGLQSRLDKLLPIFGGEWPERLKLVPMGGWRRADQGGLDDIEAWCHSVPKPVLVVIDTLETISETGKWQVATL